MGEEKYHNDFFLAIQNCYKLISFLHFQINDLKVGFLTHVN